MNLFDVVPVIKSPKAKLKTSPELLTSVEETQKLFDRLGLDVPAQVYVSINAALDEERNLVFIENDGLLAPQDRMHKSFSVRSGTIHQVPDALSMLAASPRSTMPELRQLADKLGMAIMPYHAITEKSLAAAEHFDQMIVEKFKEATQDAEMDMYVIAPIGLYDIHQHVQMEGTSAQQFYSKAFSQVFMSIQLQMPLFRTVLKTISDLSRRVSDLEGVTSQIKAQVDSLQTQLNQIQRENEIARKQEAVLRNAAVTAALAAKKAAFHAEDPMSFAIPSGTSIMSDATAIIGPVWGPDFPPELADLFEVVVQDNQRHKLSMQVMNAMFPKEAR